MFLPTRTGLVLVMDQFVEMTFIMVGLPVCFMLFHRLCDATGETYDARMELQGWSTSSFDDSDFLPVIQFDEFKNYVISWQTMQPIRALELNPGQPQALNYLGYSLVQKQMKLDEALSMIQRAVAASPDSGYIIDSLGWVLYKLGRYDEAVPYMIRAAELMPIDPVVNDHLGDVLWAVGREREARFQWNRSLSFVNYGSAAEQVDPERLRRKLDVGLDDVLAAEGSPPLQRDTER